MEYVIVGAINTVRMAKMDCCLCLLQQQGVALVANFAQGADPTLGGCNCGLKTTNKPISDPANFLHCMTQQIA